MAADTTLEEEALRRILAESSAAPHIWLTALPLLIKDLVDSVVRRHAWLMWSMIVQTFPEIWLRMVVPGSPFCQKQENGDARPGQDNLGPLHDVLRGIHGEYWDALHPAIVQALNQTFMGLASRGCFRHPAFHSGFLPWDHPASNI